MIFNCNGCNNTTYCDDPSAWFCVSCQKQIENSHWEERLMNMFAKDVNGSGKKYDSVGRFHLVINIFGSLDDPINKILTRMRSGTVIGYDTLNKAIAAQMEFMKEARIIATQGELATYGTTMIVDTRDSVCHSPEAIMELKDKTPKKA